MALLESEVYRLKFETGHHLLTIAADPYIGFTAIFDQVIKVYLESGATTTSSTAVTAVADGTPPVPVAITLASATGFVAGARVWLDVDSRQEAATIQSLAGAAMTVQLKKAHSGTYPVTVDGGEGIVRGLLRRLDVIQESISDGGVAAGIKKVDEIEFFGGAQNDGRSRVRALYDAQMRLRDELCSALGISNAWRLRQDAGSTLSPY